MNYTELLAAIIAQITPVLKEGLDPVIYAVGMLEGNDQEGGHFEVRGLHTRSGNPHAFTI